MIPTVELMPNHVSAIPIVVNMRFKNAATSGSNVAIFTLLQFESVMV